MSEFLSKFGITIICLGIILIWAFGAGKKFKASVDEKPFGEYEQPQTASVLGVLGTFFGISIGLINFNPAPEAMQQSVINLLGGMTTAFFTSIVGMGISLYFKNYQANAQKNFNGFKEDSNIADTIKKLEKGDAEKLNVLREEFKNLHDTLNANNSRVIDELRNFGNTLAESNTKAFIDALNKTMEDFNTKMTEQFGENFKQFNIAVGRLLEWQENYKIIIDTMTQNLQMIIKGIDELRISVEQIENSAASMTESSQQIQNLILTANCYEQKLEEVLKQVQTLGETSQAAVPNMLALVKNSCEEMQSYTSQATKNINLHVNAVVDNFEEKMTPTINKINEMTHYIDFQGETTLKKISEATVQSLGAMQKLSDELHRESYKIINETNAKMNDMMKTNDENLKKSLETLGTAMLKISGKFVEDYMPLVNELKKIVEIAKQVRLPARGGGTLS